MNQRWLLRPPTTAKIEGDGVEGDGGHFVLFEFSPFAGDFRDRIVHHLLMSHRVFVPLFIHDSFACRKGKGMLVASDRLMAFLGRVTVNGRCAAWALKLDVASFLPPRSTRRRPM
ncbi:MAG: hypothetical protein ACREXJ_07395 [Gammaproteobacteria bacterium]